MIGLWLMFPFLLLSPGQARVDALLADRRDTPEFHATLDRACRQKDCAWSGLYWHTDLEEAKREATNSGRPILSLRLLGNLDEELSCANSRYFRTLLYANREISRYLRDHYVLHWQSVRPAPVITVDFGGGRRMQRTITGNSVHYVLDAEGRPLEAIPGLYSPPAFLALLQDGAALHRTLARAADRELALRSYHEEAAAWFPRPESDGAREERLAVWTSGLRAMTKSLTEGPTVDRVSWDVQAVRLAADVETLVAEAAVAGPAIDDDARALIRAKRASAPEGMRSDAAFEKMLARLERTLAADTVMNETKLHAAIHRWFAENEITLDALHAYVYDVLFAAPGADPWMGLVADDSFTAITGEGLIDVPEERAPSPRR